jgi:uncharacterized protein YndB with AHSA1/START domain
MSLPASVELTLTRVFDAPRELVFEAWIQPEHFRRWFGPYGATIPYCQMEARPGGTLHFLHKLEDGQEVWIKGRYEEVSKPEKLVFTIHFSDKEGNRVDRSGFSKESRSSVTFVEKGSQTEVIIRHTGLAVDQGESEGWKQGLDRLVELLAKTTGEVHYAG